MHALRHVHGLLVPNGTLLDLHPLTEQQVEARGRVVGVIREPEFVDRDLPNTEAALERVVAEGLFALEAETEFDVLQHFDRVEELVLEAAEHLASQPVLERRIRALSPPVVLREHVVLRRLRRLPLAV